ncbi:MAG: quinolinate phosphoribosyl transferase [Rhodothermales bacterium]
MSNPNRQTQRLPSHVFDLPIQELRRGYRSDIYFWRQKKILEHHNLHPSVTMQVFQKKEAVLCGIDEAIAILKVASGRYRNEEQAYQLFDRLIELKGQARQSFQADKERYLHITREKTEVSEALDALWEDGFEELNIQALYDGDNVKPWESVMHITGDASLFAHLETVYLGVLARRTKIATNVRRVVNAANGKTVLYFPARFDHWAVQGGDGYAAHMGGVHGISTEAQGAWWGAPAAGTVPHALIASVGGDTVHAVTLFHQTYPDVNLVALVDFENDSIGTAMACARSLGDKLWAVRLDTSENMVDKSMMAHMGKFKPTGVIPELVIAMRKALDSEGFSHVRIIVSGGFDAEKIALFEARQVPVDAYGVGNALTAGSLSFTADIVLRDGQPCAKAGRSFNANNRLEKV